MPASPTENTLKNLRKRGYVAEVVEKWIPRANVRKDLFGFIDVLGVGPEGVIGVQSTSYSNTAARIKKIEEHENLEAVRKAGIAIEVHGWRKVNNRWQARIVDIS